MGTMSANGSHGPAWVVATWEPGHELTISRIDLGSDHPESHHQKIYVDGDAV
jgi:hypothetical protein